MSILRRQKKDKPLNPVKAAKLQLKAQKKEAKAAKITEKQLASVKSISAKKSVSRLGVVVSKMLTAPVAALGAATYSSYLSHGISITVPNMADPTFGLAIGTVGLSALAAAPIARSIKRLNRSATASASETSSAISTLATTVESLRQKIEGNLPASQSSVNGDIAGINSKLDSLSAKIDAIKNASASSATRSNVPSTPSVKNHVVK